jgi:hypothetical protein
MGAGCGGGFISSGGSFEGHDEPAGDDLHFSALGERSKGSSTAAATTESRNDQLKCSIS